MYYFLSTIAGVVIAIMVMANGDLGSYYGVYPATVFIHMVGLIVTTFIILIRREKIRIKEKLPFWLYLGGGVGVATVLFNNLAYGGISLSAIIALSLLGQAITSIVVDQFGWMNMPRYPFYTKKLGGLFLILLGIIVMMYGTDLQDGMAIVVSLLSGISIVVSRSINAGLAEKSSLLRSTFFNFAVGFLVSIVALLLSGYQGEIPTPLISSSIFMYLGGALSVFVVFISNLVATKISSFHTTILLFTGQLFMGIISDAIYLNEFTLGNIIGGLFILAGLSWNLLHDQKRITQQ